MQNVAWPTMIVNRPSETPNGFEHLAEGRIQGHARDDPRQGRRQDHDERDRPRG